ncbi:MAG: peptidase C1 [Myxococcota bacterium]|jgi:bleomycin hydrolase|nr:peptidase C1 [Myxococcota bacterium]
MVSSRISCTFLSRATERGLTLRLFCLLALGSLTACDASRVEEQSPPLALPVAIIEPSLQPSIADIPPETGPVGGEEAQPEAHERRPLSLRSWYEPRRPDPVLESIDRGAKARRAAMDEETRSVQEVQRARDAERHHRIQLRTSLPEDEIPHSLDTFLQIAHNPTLPQYRTGTCWAFAASSFFESESARLGGKLVQLSPMYSVYWEYLDKVGAWVDERGQSHFSEGSELGALLRTWPRAGVMPLEQFPGVRTSSGLHDHAALFAELESMLKMLEREGNWDRTLALELAAVILQRHLGSVPSRFVYEGRILSPQDYLEQVLQLELGAYRQFVSTLRHPFGELVPFEVPDNWWNDSSYCNVSMEDFVAIAERALDSGMGVGLALDTSEPGRDPDNDVMFVPDFDIPDEQLTQLAREYRIAHGVTTDDHGVHLVGIARVGAHTWFLAKDSGRGAFAGRFPGYFMLRDDYVALKGLALLVHRDALPAPGASCAAFAAAPH